MNTPNQSFELFSNINAIQNSFNPQTPRMQYYSFFPNLSDTQTNSPSQAQVNINDQLMKKRIESQMFKIMQLKQIPQPIQSLMKPLNQE